MAPVLAEQKQEVVGRWKFRGATESAVRLVESSLHLLGRLAKQVFSGESALGVAVRATQMVHDFPGNVQGFLRFVLPEMGYLGNQIQETGLGKFCGFREVGGRKKRFFVRGQDQSQGPAAPAGEELAGLHIHRVDVRPFLAIHLDRDEDLVDEPGHLIVLEGFVGHDMAPMAGGIADGQEDRFVQTLRLAEGLVSPGKPIHGIFGMLTKIWTFFLGQSIPAPGLRAVHGGSSCLN